MKFATRQLLKNPGFTGAAVLTLESAVRTPDDHRSKPKSNRLSGAMLQHGDSTSLSQTMLADHFAGAQDADWDEPDSLETCGKQPAPPPGCRAVVRGSIYKTSVFHARSRMAI